MKKVGAELREEGGSLQSQWPAHSEQPPPLNSQGLGTLRQLSHSKEGRKTILFSQHLLYAKCVEETSEKELPHSYKN